ncbi:uncharacterized protein LOC124338617 [Daphnia pulicaria]|uniref:uncharacterized protein LOC124338617 n=1 Tax=Daphnia pulicaria TaxID=35523 RepID=UPI001EEC4049|nr:uncharacterized protein LOC124338617 [Daphnia pulicaria]
MSGEEANVKQCGYLQHKGKKRLITMWRRWYCVLNGRILLFYRSETDYLNLGKFHERIDLGLVYDVVPALGVENGIQISTHTGPNWLRTTDEKSFQLWLEALQASIVLRRQGSTLKKSKTTRSSQITEQTSPISNRHQRAKSTINDQRLTFDETESSEKKIGNPFSRFSLSFIPGHGKKYSTYDGSRSIRVEQSPNEEWDGKPKPSDDNALSGTAAKLRKKPVKGPRPLSESVSNFLLLNSQSSENLTETSKDEPVKPMEVEAGTTETKEEPAKKVEVEAGPTKTKKEPAKKVEVEAGTIEKKRKVSSHLPKLPTSFGVGKLLSNLQTTAPGPANKSRRHSKSMTSLLDVAIVADTKQQKSSSQVEIVAEEQPALFAKSEDILSKRASDTSSVNYKSPVVMEESQKTVMPDQTDCPSPESKETDVKMTSPPQEASACADEDGRDPEISDDKKKDKKKIKDSTRRKSGLAMIRQFFQSAKIGMKRKGEAADKDKLSVNDTHSRKTSSNNDSVVTSEKNSARTSLIVEADIQQDIQRDLNTFEQKQTTTQQVPRESQVLEIPSIVILHRSDSQISESVQSVREEAFVATDAYKYEAKIIEIVEPESSDPVALPSNLEAINQVPPQSSDNDCTDSSSKSARNSTLSTASLENAMLNKKPRKISDVMTKEDKEVAEHRPSLPMKTKVKCPSPGYDIPRSSPIAIPSPIQFGVNPGDSAELPCFDLKDTIATTETESLKQENSSCSSELPQNQLPADSVKSETGSNTISRVSHLIKTFSNDSISYSPPTSRMSTRNSLNNPDSVERRISFAQAETVLIQEEIVQVLASD